MIQRYLLAYFRQGYESTNAKILSKPFSRLSHYY